MNSLPSDDQVHSLQRIFSRCSLADALNILVPRVFLFPTEEDGAIIALPPQDLCLHDDNVIVMDTWTNLFIWSGTNTINTVSGDERRTSKCCYFIYFHSLSDFSPPPPTTKGRLNIAYRLLDVSHLL